MGLLVDYWDVPIVVIRPVHGFVLVSTWFQYMVTGTMATQPLIEERLEGRRRGSWRLRGREWHQQSHRLRKACCRHCRWTRRSGGPFIRLYAAQELGWCFVLRSQTIVHTDNR